MSGLVSRNPLHENHLSLFLLFHVHLFHNSQNNEKYRGRPKGQSHSAKGDLRLRKTVYDKL